MRLSCFFLLVKLFFYIIFIQYAFALNMKGKKGYGAFNS